ncbi:MAG: hypothetical protein LBB85_03495 [Dysgonamonadaceae bacterium]|jgi:hypothetical protein|nr:hypothetical protein [Dysgonamonadaceae bacterium]
MEQNKYIGELIEKYFEGSTSLKEEETLQNYFQRRDRPSEWELYRPLFRYFAEEKQKRKAPAWPIRSFGLGMGAAAACVLLFFGMKFLSPNTNQLSASSWMYIDGKKYTNIEHIQTEALKALENLSENEEAIYSSQVEALDLFVSNN